MLAVVHAKSGTFEITQVGCTATTMGADVIEIPNTPVRAMSTVLAGTLPPTSSPCP
ncbi:MAG: hypothetical protein ACRDOF_03595 [Gaiellaceae bacterium]